MKKNQQLRPVLRLLLHTILCICLSNYNVAAQVEKNMDIEPNFECEEEPDNFGIAQFYTKNYPNKDGQIVVGLPIKYKASPDDNTPFQWSLSGSVNGNLDAWQLDVNATEPINAPTNDKGTMYIPKTTIPMSYTHFGTSLGNLSVENDIGETATKDVKVFFEKDEKNHHAQDEANWFYYWKQLVADRLNGVTVKVYDVSQDNDGNPITGEEGWVYKEIEIQLVYNPTYASLSLNANGFSSSLGFSEIDRDFDPFPNLNVAVLSNATAIINVGDLCSRVNGQKYLPCSTHGDPTCQYGGSMDIVQTASNFNTTTGIHAFIKTLEHELEHIRIFGKIWTDYHYTLSPNNEMTNDKDKDGYPDAWEVLPAQIPFMFTTVDMRDNYGNGNTYRPDLYPAQTDGASAGTNYEEKRCRDHEHNNVNTTALDNLDWSFTKTFYHNQFQGKQW